MFYPVHETWLDAGFHTLRWVCFNHENARIYKDQLLLTWTALYDWQSAGAADRCIAYTKPTDHFNFGFEYNKIYAPGLFRIANLPTMTYICINMAVSTAEIKGIMPIWVIIIINSIMVRMVVSEWQIVYLDNPRYNQRKTIEVNLGNYSASSVQALFSSTPYRLRQQTSSPDSY